LVKNELDLHHIRFIKEVNSDFPPLYLDKSGLQQVLLNLFMNSIQAMENGGELKVDSVPDQGSRFTIWLPIA
jgi:signal transduction histidine kinase